MHTQQPNNPTQICEHILAENKRYNIEHQILNSEIAIAERLLARRLELTSAYKELHSALHEHPYALQDFLGVILSTAAYWNPEKIAQARAARNELDRINCQIAKQARELAALLAQRSELGNSSGFSSNTHYHICEVIEAAAKGNGHFSTYVKEPLQSLYGRFDLKYWPPLRDVLLEISSDAEAADTEALDPLTEAATAAKRSSLYDFFKALFAAIEENRTRNHGRLPNDFAVTNNTLASLVNCALNLPPEKLIDTSYIKRLRQSLRAEAKSANEC